MATTTTAADRPSDSGADVNETQSAVQKLRDQADAVVQRIQPQIAAVSSYAREEPTKALLLSAAAGAALMGLVALMVRSGGSRSVGSSAASAGTSAMAAIRDAALDLADSAQSMAADAFEAAQKRAADLVDAAHQRASDVLGSSQKRANDAVGSTQKRAAASMDSVTESVADAWGKVRDRAAPVVDKLKPQIDAAAAYAKEDPTRAALGLAAAGAIVAGLIALSRSASDDSMR
jgi:ElaB/YqjD/DUF883 family membrane-anchored ribosome-binding protein